jgi:hypothetical protein
MPLKSLKLSQMIYRLKEKFSSQIQYFIESQYLAAQILILMKRFKSILDTKMGISLKI